MDRNRLFDNGQAARLLLEATGDRELVEAQRNKTKSDIQIRLRKAAILTTYPVPIRRQGTT